MPTGRMNFLLQTVTRRIDKADDNDDDDDDDDGTWDYWIACDGEMRG